MKRSYTCVPAPTVTACKEMARTLIKHDFAYITADTIPYIDTYVKTNASHYEYLITGILDCRYSDFRIDFEEWLQNEIKTIYNKTFNN